MRKKLEAAGLWAWNALQAYQLWAWLGGTSVISTAFLAVFARLRELSLGWQIFFVVGVASLWLLLVRLVSPPLFKRFHISPRTKSRAEPLTISQVGTMGLGGAPPSTNGGQERALTIYSNLLGSDKRNLTKLVFAEKYTASFANVSEYGGYIDFLFHLVNSSILGTKLERSGEGHVVFEGDPQHVGDDPIELERVPEVPGIQLDHGERKALKLRQWLLPEVAKKIIYGAKRDEGREIGFSFAGVEISMTSQTLLGEAGPTYNLVFARWHSYRVFSGTPDMKVTRAEQVIVQ